MTNFAFDAINFGKTRLFEFTFPFELDDNAMAKRVLRFFFRVLFGFENFCVLLRSIYKDYRKFKIKLFDPIEK